MDFFFLSGLVEKKWGLKYQWRGGQTHGTVQPLVFALDWSFRCNSESKVRLVSVAETLSIFLHPISKDAGEWNRGESLQIDETNYFSTARTKRIWNGYTHKNIHSPNYNHANELSVLWHEENFLQWKAKRMVNKPSLLLLGPVVKISLMRDQVAAAVYPLSPWKHSFDHTEEQCLTDWKQKSN